MSISISIGTSSSLLTTPRKLPRPGTDKEGKAQQNQEDLRSNQASVPNFRPLAPLTDHDMMISHPDRSCWTPLQIQTKS